MMTETQAREWVADHSDDDNLCDDHLRAAFAALYEREPDADDEIVGLWSLCCAACDDTDALVCGCKIQHDNSGVGHNWRDLAADDINADVREAIEAEIIDGKLTECDDWTGPDGQHYRWTEA